MQILGKSYAGDTLLENDHLISISSSLNSGMRPALYIHEWTITGVYGGYEYEDIKNIDHRNLTSVTGIGRF